MLADNEIGVHVQRVGLGQAGNNWLAHLRCRSKFRRYCEVTLWRGVKALRRIQIGAETVAGTGVAATAKWRGGTIRDDLDLVLVEGGYRGIGTDRTYIQKYRSDVGNWMVEAATFEAAAVFGNDGYQIGRRASDGAGDGKIWAFPLPTTSQNTIKTYV